MYESGTSTALAVEMRGAEFLWMVSVLREGAGADDASAVNSDKLISPRMMKNGWRCDGWRVYRIWLWMMVLLGSC